MRRESPIVPETKIDRPVLVWQPTTGRPIEYEVWPERPLTIGRDGASTVVIDSPFVSKQHAVIRYTVGQYQVEDLKSANGTKVNGAPIAVSLLAPGDVLEVGDQRFVFMEAAVSKGGAGLGRNAKLALAAGGTLVVLGGLFALILSSSAPPSTGAAAVRPGAPAAAKTPPVVPAVDVNSEAVREVLSRAQQAGIKPVDALLDEGTVALEAGRLREATQLYGAVLRREPGHESAKRRFEDAKAEWAEAIADHAAEADRAFDELRLQDAILEWGKVLLLTDTTDPRHAIAQSGIDRARQRLVR